VFGQAQNAWAVSRSSREKAAHHRKTPDKKGEKRDRGATVPKLWLLEQEKGVWGGGGGGGGKSTEELVLREFGFKNAGVARNQLKGALAMEKGERETKKDS